MSKIHKCVETERAPPTPCPRECSHQHDQIDRVGWRSRRTIDLHRTAIQAEGQFWPLYGTTFSTGVLNLNVTNVPFFLSSRLRCAWFDNFFSSVSATGCCDLMAFLEMGWAYCWERINKFQADNIKGTHVSLVPLAVGGSIDQNDSTLNESVCANKLVVGGIVDLVPRISI
jgi:hypothetical protein